MPGYISDIFRMIEKDIEDLNKRIEDLQKRLSELEKKGEVA